MSGPYFSHVISADGSRIFWTDLNTGHIYVRENGTTTVEISSAGQYQTASSDGSMVFYTNGDLYEYELENGQTTDLTPGVPVKRVRWRKRRRQIRLLHDDEPAMSNCGTKAPRR